MCWRPNHLSRSNLLTTQLMASGRAMPETVAAGKIWVSQAFRKTVRLVKWSALEQQHTSAGVLAETCRQDRACRAGLKILPDVVERGMNAELLRLNDQNLLLNQLLARTHNIIYSSRRRSFLGGLTFLRKDYPRHFRRLLHGWKVGTLLENPQRCLRNLGRERARLFRGAERILAPRNHERRARDLPQDRARIRPVQQRVDLPRVVLGRGRTQRMGGGRRGIARIGAGDDGEQRGGIGDRTRERPDGVLARRDRNDTGAADEPRVA